MRKILTVFVTMFLATCSAQPASAALNCEEYRKVAETIMFVRQSGMPIESAATAIYNSKLDDEAKFRTTTLLIDAYNEERYEHHEDQEYMIFDFGSTKYKECLRGAI